MFSKNIFRAYDIRGKYGEDFDDDFAYRLGRVLAKHLNAKKIVVSRDMRPSSDALSERVIDGIVSLGCDVVDIGQTSTPLFYFGVINEGACGGVMITASHMGEEFNGFKITRTQAINIGGDKFWEEAKELFSEEIKSSNTRGDVSVKGLLADYVRFVVHHSGLDTHDIESSVKFIGNKMVVREACAITDKLSISVVESGEDIVFKFDPDGDRLVVYSSDGEKIRGDLIGGMLAGYYYPDSKVVYDLRYSRGVLEYMRSCGIEPIPSKIGHTLIKAVMREHEADFCGEQSGHMFFKETGYIETSMLAALKILNAIKETGKDINKLIEPAFGWSTTEEINFPLTSRNEVSDIFDKLRKRYKDAEINEVDGIFVKYPDWSFILRPSNNDPMLRLIVDAKTDKLMREKEGELRDMLG